MQISDAFQEMFKPWRYRVYWGGRGGGKSENVCRALLIKGMMNPLRILCCREFQTSISDSVHKLLSDIIKENDLDKFYTVNQNTIRGENGTEFIFKGLRHNTTEIKSLANIDECFVEEAEKVSDNSWELLIPTIRKEGSSITVVFNAKNATDPTYQRFVVTKRDDCYVKKVNYYDNPFFPSVLEKERSELQKNDPEAYLHVWEGEFDTRYSGAVYAKLIAKIAEAGRISPQVKHDPLYPVYTAWDLGFDDTTSVIFFQIGSGEIFIIDYYENNHEDIIHYCEVLYGRKIEVSERDNANGSITKWNLTEDNEHAHRKLYNYHAHYVPHDAGYQMQAAAGRSIVSQADNVGVKMFVLPATSSQNSIEALRMTIPKLWINEEKCKDLVNALMQYHFEYDEDLKRFSKLPVHDWSSHASDAAEIMARVWREQGITQKQLDITRQHAKFHTQRQDHGMVREDPYRLRSKN